MKNDGKGNSSLARLLVMGLLVAIDAGGANSGFGAGIMGRPFFTGISLLFAGWITLPIGAIIGYFYESFLISKVNH